jgi:hypothetical protein
VGWIVSAVILVRLTAMIIRPSQQALTPKGKYICTAKRS